MRFLVGCSAVIAFVAFIIVFVVSLFVGAATWTDSLIMGTLTASVVFIVVLLLFVRDFARHSATVRTVRRHLLACGDTSDENFIASRATNVAMLLLETRKAIARFFDVPTTKVGRDAHLIHDLRVDKLEPWFQFYVVDSVIASQPVEPKQFGFTMANLVSIDDLTHAIRKVLDDLKLHS